MLQVILAFLLITKIDLPVFLKFLGYGSVDHCLCPFPEKKALTSLVHSNYSKVGNERFPYGTEVQLKHLHDEAS